jgi:hypothetical protein
MTNMILSYPRKRAFERHVQSIKYVLSSNCGWQYRLHGTNGSLYWVVLSYSVIGKTQKSETDAMCLFLSRSDDMLV